MPPTVPCGIPCIGVVFARLIKGGKNEGVFPFIVPLNDGYKMNLGVTAQYARDLASVWFI
jgi:acyl-CoA oxidase